ncbi:MAG: hypothetical protein GEV05_25750 [Betaproteobacteria bacterium]|nr:hypothetical protein [Betaproteobacteria bacterium]
MTVMLWVDASLARGERRFEVSAKERRVRCHGRSSEASKLGCIVHNVQHRKLHTPSIVLRPLESPCQIVHNVLDEEGRYTSAPLGDAERGTCVCNPDDRRCEHVPRREARRHHAGRLNRTTTYRLLKCLARQGAVRIESRGRYFLGPLLLELAIAARQNQRLKEMYAPTLRRIAEATGDTVFLQLRSGIESVCIDRCLGTYPVQTLIVDVGTRRPLGVGAAGVAILAASPAQESDRIIKANAASFLLLGTSAATVSKAVRTGRERGYVSAPVPGVPGVKAIALAIKDEEDDVFAAIAVAGIDRRMTRTRQSELVNIVRRELRATTKRYMAEREEMASDIVEQRRRRGAIGSKSA